MILKLGRVSSDGNITETMFTRSQEVAVCLMLSVREFVAYAEMFERVQSRGDAWPTLFCGPGSLANNPSATLAWKEDPQGWADYLASIPMADNPIYQSASDPAPDTQVFHVGLFGQMQKLLAEREHLLRVVEAAERALNRKMDGRARFQIKSALYALRAWKKANP